MLTLLLIGLVGGFITAVSPCVLPVLPLVFLSGGVPASRQGAEPARRSRPYAVMAGLVVSFSLITLFGTLVLGSLPVPPDILRWAGLGVLLLLGVAMMFPALQDLLERPFARIGQRRVGGGRGGFLLGLVLGTVYVPCAGPVLAAITVAGATDGSACGRSCSTVALRRRHGGAAARLRAGRPEDGRAGARVPRTAARGPVRRRR